MLQMTDCLITVSIIFILLAACNPESSKTISITEKNADSTIELSKGDILEVMLTANPSTGFMWESRSLDTTILKQKGEWNFVPDIVAPGFAGSPGKLTSYFQAVGSGQMTLQLVYRRPFEPETIPPAQIFAITVVVK